MMGEIVEKKLYNAASKGDLPTLHQLLQQDPYLIDGVSFACSRNLLHIATVFGQEAIVEEVLKINPRLARIQDSQKLSPLHIAAAEGHIEIAKKLISIAPEMCWWRDDQGMNPVHIAAMNGHVEVLELLLQENPLPAMERLHRGQTVLHLCVKHRQLVALKVMVEKLEELVDASDDDGDTLLHMAVKSNQLESQTIRYLVESNEINKQTRNSMGKTALQNLNDSATNYSEMRSLLLSLSRPLKILPKLTDMTMVVVVLIATMAFQATISPPGGVWQDNTSSHKAGEAVMASSHPKLYILFARANTTAFVSSIITIVLITTGGPSESAFILTIALYAMWGSLVAIAVSYGASTVVMNPSIGTKPTGTVVALVTAAALSIYIFTMVLIYISLLYSSWRRQKRRQQEVTTHSLIRPFFHWIFQQLETRRENI